MTRAIILTTLTIIFSTTLTSVGWARELTRWEEEQLEWQAFIAIGRAGYDCRLREYSKCFQKDWDSSSFWRRSFTTKVGDSCPSPDNVMNYKEVCDAEVDALRASMAE